MAGASVLDLGCGTGHAVNVAARAFPASRFLGIDIDPGVITTASAERDELGLSNADFSVGDAAELAPEPGFDVITAFDAIHDQHTPRSARCGGQSRRAGCSPRRASARSRSSTRRGRRTVCTSAGPGRPESSL